MKSGNERFVDGVPAHPRQDVERRTEIAVAQTPAAALFGCSDSRLAAEIIFDLGLGDLFVVRNAGQVISSSVIGSLEYAVAVLQVPLIVVLRHDECGAVRAAVDSQGPNAPLLPAHIKSLVSEIVPAVRAVGVTAEDGTIDIEHLDVDLVGRTHLRDTVAALLAGSELISEAVAAGTLAIVGADYHLADGRVEADVVLGDVA
ncbi:carbonic anhydrase [Herbiconiux sp. L3-i23]|nr:carbonic anhydrase [Herbiconiux sp. L3-i23]